MPPSFDWQDAPFQPLAEHMTHVRACIDRVVPMFECIRAQDYERCELSADVKIDLNERDITRAKQIANYPWFRKKQPWQREIRRMLRNGFKMEVESLITKDISYVTETYVPQRLAAGDFLD